MLCEGQNTEPQYIMGFRRWCRNPRVDVEIARERGVPLTLAQKAKELKVRAERLAVREEDENLAYDEVWCVFDIDVHPHVAEALQLARDNGIKAAVSNPCVEVWLLLHFRENPGMQDRHSMQRMMRSFIRDYDKSIDFEVFKRGYADAVRRASRLDVLAAEDGELGRNPSTGFYLLTTSIQKGSEGFDVPSE
ncbi:RloB family protein [Corallococcus interemptor]|uniref:RloB family protein n=1 Tax=Corallococcus interemptor TaxID=2316720 RepID=UPI002447C56D|nr:RloB family protein [Corallococcus interemptor]